MNGPNMLHFVKKTVILFDEMTVIIRVTKQLKGIDAPGLRTNRFRSMISGKDMTDKLLEIKFCKIVNWWRRISW
jgi:hypothetical protein